MHTDLLTRLRDRSWRLSPQRRVVAEVLAGGTAAPGATSFELAAECGSEVYGILSNPYLARGARSAAYRARVRVEGDVFSYEEETAIEHARWPEPIRHTDRNRLHRVAAT